MEAQYPQTAVPQFGAYGPQLTPQGFFGGLLGGPLGGLIGGGIGGLFGNPNLGRQIGQTLGTVGGGILPFSVDPLTAAYAQQAQQAQLAPQGFFGNLIGQLGQPVGGAIGSIFGNQQLGNQLGGIAGQLGRFLPFSVDPLTAAYAQQAQQAQFAPQGFFGNLLGQIGQPLGGAIGSIFGNQQLGSQLGGVAGQLGRFLPFSVDPLTAAYAQQAQQAQFAPQGFFGNLLGQIGQPLGGAIGSLFGNQQLGGQLGGAAGQLGRFLPFQAQPGFQGGYLY
ncbi:MAG TPA: hypothetical protein VGD45_06845 [Steroidobacter sp.]|uniref:hypothetical protein n=1 Tax=Steroidobacter sp. TaxID=1978227 RepID=UPI002ED9149E